MKMNEIIREKRKEIGLTQEQMALRLGVSTPAVNKWEKGVSYPDVTMLAPIARLLKINTDTLLSFHEELSDKEIAAFMNELASTLTTKGFQEGYDIAVSKINEYPNCYKLINSIALSLEGSMIYLGVKDKEKYEGYIEELYKRVMDSDDIEVSNSAKTMLISKYTNRKEFDKAQNLLDTVSKMNEHKNIYQARIYFEQGKVEDAERLLQIQIRRSVMDLYMNLSSMITYSLRDNDRNSAEYYNDILKKTIELYDLGSYMSSIGETEIYAYDKDIDKTIRLLEETIKSIPHLNRMYDSKLYSLIFKDYNTDAEKEKKMNDMFNQLKKSILSAVREDEKFEFLKDTEEFKKLIEEYES